MEMIERKQDCLSGRLDLEPLFAFEEFPVFMGCTEQGVEQDLKVDMNWQISRSTGFIQLQSLLPLDVLYPESHGSGCVGKLWNEHHKAFADFIRGYAPKMVLEIGGAHGVLSKNYNEADHGCAWYIVEPNPSPSEDLKAEFIQGFFDENFSFDKEVNAIIHSHVFEHVYDPNQFMKDIASFLPEGRHLIFSLPNMEVMLQRKYTNCINFEHTIFLTEPYVEWLLAKYGFRILEKKYFRDDHSIFYACVRDGSVTPVELPGKALYEHNKKLYLEYVDYHKQLIEELNERIASVQEQPIYLFGAHVFAQYLIAFGLDTEKIVCLLDNDKNKQGKRLYGTSLTVASPTILNEVSNPVVILKAGVYNEEIKSDILGNINAQTIFWE